MTLKEILAKIKASMGADAPAEVTTLLADAERQLADLQESKSAADRESAGRKQTIRELTDKVALLESELSKASSPEAKAELERLKGIEEQHKAHLAEQETAIRNQWAEAYKILNVDNTSKLFDKVSKVKDRFLMPANGTELTIDQIKQNMLVYGALESAGAFAVETTDAGGKSPANPNGGQVAKGTPLGYIQTVVSK